MFLAARGAERQDMLGVGSAGPKDISRADAPAEVLASVLTTPEGGPPYPFKIDYDESLIDELFSRPVTVVGGQPAAINKPSAVTVPEEFGYSLKKRVAAAIEQRCVA